MLGTLVGAGSGTVASDLYSQLAHKEALTALIDEFLNRFIQ